MLRLLALLGGWCALALAPPAGICWLPPCLFHSLTGRPCPLCGLTRSLRLLLHGEMAAALAFHPFGPVVFTLLLLLTVEAAIWLRRPHWQAPWAAVTRRALPPGLLLVAVYGGLRAARLLP